VLLASSEMDEVVNLSHRVLVMRGRRIVAELAADGHTDAEIKNEVLHHAMGLATPVAS
jgi:ribose transport system ATP-binding protein